MPEYGALPGDLIVAEPANPTHPVILTRRLPREALQRIKAACRPVEQPRRLTLMKG
jgi:hypothetical protein